MSELFKKRLEHSPEYIAWDIALKFQKSCPPKETSSDFVYRLRDMISEEIWKERKEFQEQLHNLESQLKEANEKLGEIRIAQLEAMIQGLIEAQKPLLEEWAKLTKEEA